MLLTAAFIAAAGCASSGSKDVAMAGESAANCPLMLQDSVFSVGGPVYRECAVKTKAKVIPSNVRMDFQPQGSTKDCYSAELEFVVDVTGAPEIRTARVARSNDTGFAESIMALLPRLRFDAATIDGVPVRQITTYKQSMQVMRVVVAAGSPRPSAPPRIPSSPKC